MMAPIAIELEWVTPLLISVAIVGSLLFVLCPRKMRAQETFESQQLPRVAPARTSGEEPVDM